MVIAFSRARATNVPQRLAKFLVPRQYRNRKRASKTENPPEKLL
jgi:hypothetical protein